MRYGDMWSYGGINSKTIEKCHNITVVEQWTWTLCMEQMTIYRNLSQADVNLGWKLEIKCLEQSEGIKKSPFNMYKDVFLFVLLAD